jgi:putative heme iron utilization protein
MTEEFDALACARKLLAGCDRAALASLGDDDMPFASLVTVSVDIRRQPILLLSDLAVHTGNLRQRPQASLLLVEERSTAADPLVQDRLTLCGHVRVCDDQDAASETFLRDHPHAAGYAGFADFAFYRMACSSAHLVAGFGRIESLSADHLFLK